MGSEGGGEEEVRAYTREGPWAAEILGGGLGRFSGIEGLMEVGGAVCEMWTEGVQMEKCVRYGATTRK